MNGNIFKRHELKYLVSSEQRSLMLSYFKDRMIPDEHGESTICSIYYDTADFRLARRSLEKPVYKEKLRMRSYGTASGDTRVFLELKKKYKGIVYKRRISLSEKQATAFLCGGGTLPEDTQIGREIIYFTQFYKGLRPAVYLCYDRCAYYAADDRDLRVTFDRNIRWRNELVDLKIPPDGEQLLKEGYSLMEIKSDKALPLWLTAALSNGKIRQTSFSKYGTAYTTMIKRAAEKTDDNTDNLKNRSKCYA